MAVCTPQGAKLLRGWRKVGIFEKGIGAELPDAYKKFWREWKELTPTAVHYVPKEGNWERDELTGQVKPIQNIPLPLKFPIESNKGIWGGEGVVMGFQKRNPTKRRVPHFWVPVLKRSVVYSEVLNKYMSVVVTDRTIRLINEHFGFDHYLLKTLACDLRSELALGLKRKILIALEQHCPAYADKPKSQEEIFMKYKQYLSGYTSDEIAWYGLTFSQACMKLRQQQIASTEVKPLKHLYRLELIEKIKSAGIKEAESVNLLKDDSRKSASWLHKMNPFSKET